ncbi:MAG TPA: restriction endonuclease, partial [Clostridiales bacterium]|nr:restriction endonuclease [Clostridiales bacterium]
MEDLKAWIPEDMLEKFDFYNYNHAAEILSQSFASEFYGFLDALQAIQISVSDILTPGGNQSPTPPKFSVLLDPDGWKEIRISGDLLVKI